MEWGGIFGVILTDAVKIVTLGVIWYCGLAIRRVSRTDSRGAEFHTGKNGKRVEGKFQSNTHYAPLVLKKTAFYGVSRLCEARCDVCELLAIPP